MFFSLRYFSLIQFSMFYQYSVAGEEGPAILLVHGFGAFWEHYRDNIDVIAGVGNRVWAMTLLGFGRSEKPNIIYSELLWAELLRDFIVDVIGEPVHLVGNSIGGTCLASLNMCPLSISKHELHLSLTQINCTHRISADGLISKLLLVIKSSRGW